MSATSHRSSQPTAYRPRRPHWFDRLLLVAHASGALLALDIVADQFAGGTGRLTPWPPGGELPVSATVLALAYLLAALPWRPPPLRAPASEIIAQPRLDESIPPTEKRENDHGARAKATTPPAEPSAGAIRRVTARLAPRILGRRAVRLLRRAERDPYPDDAPARPATRRR